MHVRIVTSYITLEAVMKNYQIIKNNYQKYGLS